MSENDDQVADQSGVEGQSTNPMSFVMQVAPSVDFTERGSEESTSYIAHDRRSGKYFRFGVREYHAVSLMDGNRSLGEIEQQLSSDGVEWTPVDVLAFAKQLTQSRLAQVVERQPESQAEKETSKADSDRGTIQEESHKKADVNPVRMFASFFSMILSQRFPLADGDRVASRLMPWLSTLFSKTALVSWTFLVLSGISIAWSHSAEFGVELRRIFDQQIWLVLAILWCSLKVVHECGHAVCAKHFGARVGKMGVMLFLFAPLAYVDVTDAWKLPRRSERVFIALAGVYFELAIGAIAAWVWWFAPLGMTKHLAAQVFLLAGPATLLVNANPLLRLDGYYVLSDLLEIPNLRAHGRKRLIGWIDLVLFRLPSQGSPLTGWRADVAVFHAACSIVFQVVWMTGLVFAVSKWMKGLGIGLAVVAALMWGIVPLAGWMHRVWTVEPRRGFRLSQYQRRLIAVLLITSIGIQYAAVESSPFSRRVPVIVRYQNEQISRAASDAFVASVYIKCGDRVEKGDLLMELEQPEITLQRDQWLDQRELALAKAIQYQRRGELSLSATEAENAASLERQIQEVQHQIDALRITATRSGRVTSPDTDTMLGRYVQKGHELVRVSDPQEKELLAVIAEDNLDAYSEAVKSNGAAEIRLRGGIEIKTTLRPLQPSASRTLPHPALAASVGGPLPVQASQESDGQNNAKNRGETRLIEPQLKTVLPLDAYASSTVNVGQIGRLTIPDDRSIVSRIWDRLVNQQ